MSGLEDIRARLDAASPWPWMTKGHCGTDGCRPCSYNRDRVVMDASGLGTVAVVDTYEAGTKADTDLIANAPQDIADLLAVAEEARNVLAAHDEAAEADAEMDWTGPMVDLRLRAALAALDPTTERGA